MPLASHLPVPIPGPDATFPEAKDVLIEMGLGVRAGRAEPAKAEVLKAEGRGLYIHHRKAFLSVGTQQE